MGWFAYAPLTAQTFSPGHSTDFWTLSLLVSGIGSIGTAANIIATIVCLRCKGMTLGKMPLLAWLNLTMGGLVILVIGPLTAAQLMLLVDRYLGGHFFDTQAGGSAVMWMHFFWVFGHPEVYVLVIPAFAFVSEIIPVFSRKAMFGYPIMVAATVCIGFISMSVWAHHMFTVGMSAAGNTFFVLSTMAIAVPTGIKIFNWLATMWGGQIHFRVPMLFCIAFLFQFLIAGLTGVMLAAAPFDWQLTASYFVVAHFHYVIVGGILFAIFGAFYYWFPKMSGRMYNEKLGQLHFWLFLIGFHLTFDFMHIPGILGMPRRIYTYEPGRGWDIWNFIVTIGVFFRPRACWFLSATCSGPTSVVKSPEALIARRRRVDVNVYRLSLRLRAARALHHRPRAVRCRRGRKLLQQHYIGSIVAKNSGGSATYGKIAAARALGIAVIMLRRPRSRPRKPPRPLTRHGVA